MLELLSVTLVPRGDEYRESSVSVHNAVVEEVRRRAIVTHSPSLLEWQVRVPEDGRFDFASGLLDDVSEVTFRVTAAVGGDESKLFEETTTDASEWQARSIDLAPYAGKTATLTLETESEVAGTIAFWGSPTLSGSAPVATDRPNIIFYVIDGGWADDMSVYGYNRRTTPYLERLAEEGVVFEYAYSNSTWTKPSTASFMTSLQNSVFVKNPMARFEPLPANVVTMAEHVYGAGYQTAVFTSNPWAGTVSGLDRGVGLMRDGYVRRDYTSSVELHDAFWAWRDALPVQPYWAHFQTTDVHEYEGGLPAPVAPFSGLYVTAERRREFYEEWERVDATGLSWHNGAFEAAGIDRVGFFETMRSLYDESMAHQDYQIGRLVERLRDRGEWEHTLLIIAADHGITAAVYDVTALMQETMPPPWNEPMLRSSITRVPLMFIWPGHIEGGRRFEDPVSMIDVLPTLLDLLGLSQPEILQGQSLAPLLRGEPGWEARPVILDEVSLNPRTGGYQGLIEIIDGRWGASLEVFNVKTAEKFQRPWPLLLYDVWADPGALHPVNEQYPDLVEKYAALLEAQWEAHQALAKQFTPGKATVLTPEQLRTLRSLGYIK
jgi:arylsulfatase A-like enzyme